MRHLLAVASLVMLTACASEPGASAGGSLIDGLPQWMTGLPDDGPIFGLTALQQAPQDAGYAGFNNASPQMAATHAAQICTLGYQRLAEETAPGEPVNFTLWRGRCNPYRPTL
jgi:hypothetical protein